MDQEQRITLVSHELCPYVQRAVIALTEKGVPFRRLDVDLAAKPGWFKAISPLGKVPLLRTGRAVLFESTVILEYLEETQPHPLHPGDPLERAEHRSWIEFGTALLNDIAGFYNAPDAAGFAAKSEALTAKFTQLEARLGQGPWFAGERFSLVDAVFGPVFRYVDAFERIGAFEIPSGMRKVAAWRAALERRPSIRAAVAPSYPERLLAFLAARSGSHLSRRMLQEAAV